MTTLAPLLQSFFTQRLLQQRHASPHTVASYRDTFRLLLGFIHERSGKTPSTLELDDLDASTISAFLDHLERTRGNTVRTRNTRLAALHSFFAYAALECPERAQLIQRVLAIPAKRFDTALVCYLTRDEIDAVLASPDRSTWIGRRDHALLALAVQTGLRVSELCNLRHDDAHLGTGAHVRCEGKGRKQRCTPLARPTATVLRVWMNELSDDPEGPLFPSRSGHPLTRGAIWRLVVKHAAAAHQRCPSLATKQVTPHVLRHSAAMALLHCGVDTSVIALWLGHETLQSTNVYLHADMALKERALARTAPPATKPGRYQPPDDLLDFLDHL